MTPSAAKYFIHEAQEQKVIGWAEESHTNEQSHQTDLKKSVLNLEIRGEQEESTGKNGKNTWGCFSVEEEEMGIDPSPNSFCGPKWRVPRGQVLWPRGAPYSGPCWPYGVPLLAVSSPANITYLQIFLEFFEKIF